MATVRHKKPENWLAAVDANGHGLNEERPLALGEQASEALLMGLRLDEGIDLAALAGRFELGADALIDHAKVDFYVRQGLVWQQGNRLGVTQAGMSLLDGLLAELVRGELVSA
jgi:oxygen-independent coproporphyrinogen-3 oxidase